ncbi:serine acetyltransferase 2-like [Neltuma alba]|uniref:serine acetyltransferase 2-like n=1 Tax=Neltuma alba TaxID=207710 RepID=UPI0010A38596|nr:serine acetyltransferase 2-like [Prosopis alba]
MLAGPLPLGARELQNKTDEPNNIRFLSSAYRLERVFPVYAMGTPNPDSDSVLASSFDDSGGADPIWDAVRQEAKLEAEKAPILSSFLYASVLSHDCLEQALAFVVANRLQNPNLLATQLTDIFCDVMMHDKGIQRSIRLDVQAFKDRDPACLSYCSALLYMKGYHALQVHRVAHALWGEGRQVLASALQSRASEVVFYFIETSTTCIRLFHISVSDPGCHILAAAAKIGEGILLDHGTGMVIGETAIVGNRVSLMHGVTLGGSGKEIGDRHPKIGDGALIGACATILGNIRIGKGAMVAAGSLVLKEVPPHSMVAGIPANAIGYLHEHDPSLSMKHDATKDYFEHIAANFRDGKSTG